MSSEKSLNSAFRNLKNKRKRVIEDDEENDNPIPNKIQKSGETLTNPFVNKPFIRKEWFSGTSTMNYFCKDPLLDWLNEYRVPEQNKEIIPHQTPTPNQAETVKSDSAISFKKFIMDKGNQFEKTIMNMLRKRFPNSIKDIGGNGLNLSFDKYTETIHSMLEGVPIIYSGVVYNFDDNTYGIPDLIVRSDYINRLVKYPILEPQELYKKCPKLNTGSSHKNYYYIIVDIKFKTLRLRADGCHLLNEGLIPAYKAQLFVYNKAISHIQGYDPNISFLLGRGWSFIKMNIRYRNSNPFDRLGRINYETVDSHIQPKLKDALVWLKDVRTNGKDWNPFKPHRPELYPNMCNSYDAGWRGYKEKLSESLKEITNVWMCGVKNREFAHNNSVYSWDDERCNSLTLGIGGRKISKIVDAMLVINRSETCLMYPKIIKNNFCDWNTKREYEFFVDFETINDAITCELSEDSLTTGYSMIFMIGLYYIDPESGECIYESFTVDNMTIQEEYRICSELNAHIEFLIEYMSAQRGDAIDAKDVDRKKVAFYHWGSHESNVWDEVVNRHCKSGSGARWLIKDVLWIDMLKIFKDTPIIIKGCLDFSLKTIAKKMHSYGMIKSVWDESLGVADGTGAMLSAYFASKECKKQNSSLKETAIISDIESYNKIDTKVLHEILTYLRENHLENAENVEIDNMDVEEF